MTTVSISHRRAENRTWGKNHIGPRRVVVCMRIIDVSGQDFEVPVRFHDTVDMSEATVTHPTNQPGVKRYVSQSITQADLTAGVSCTVALTGEPTGILPLAAYVVTSATATSSSGDTTGLNVKVGPVADDDGYVQTSATLGAAGRKERSSGSSPAAMLGTYRAVDALLATFTATGGDPDCADISALAMKVVIYYVEVATE